MAHTVSIMFTFRRPIHESIPVCVFVFSIEVCFYCVVRVRAPSHLLM